VGGEWAVAAIYVSHRTLVLSYLTSLSARSDLRCVSACLEHDESRYGKQASNRFETCGVLCDHTNIAPIEGSEVSALSRIVVAA